MIDLSELSGLNAMQAVDLALHWAARGVPVLPTNPDTKAPWVGKEWERKATRDEATIREWWRQKPTARVGIKTGLACGCGCLDGPDVLDFDVSDGKPGIEQRRALVLAEVLDSTKAMRVVTPSGGEHWWFEGSTQHNKQNDDSVWGVDLRAHHGMVLAPGNPGYEVKGVPWSGLGPSPVWAVVAACPGIKQKPGAKRAQPTPPPVVRKPSRLVGPAQPEIQNAPGEESPLDWFCRTNDLEVLLVQDGWTYAYEHQDRRYFVRPGKDPKDGVSANVMINPSDGRQTLMNFSTSVDLPTDRGLSAAQYWAFTRHGGDVRAAAKSIRTTMMPRRQTATTTGLVAPGTTQQAQPGASVPPGAPVAPVATRTAELVPSSEAGVPEPVRAFWSRRPELREVWWQSQISDTSPWAVLGSILAEVAGRIGPHVMLPPKGGVGAPASLNLLVAISGNSGEDKGVSGQVARGFVGNPRPPHRKPGTGQGIAAMFTTQTKEGPVQENDTVVLNVAEITQLGAHMSQQGATITSTLLEVYMAEELGEHYANKELRRPVKEGTYRLALVAGVQPDNAAIIFDHAGSGLPQRFVWMPAFWADSVLPESGLVAPAPGSEQKRWRAWNAILPGTLDDSLDATGWSPSDAASGLQSPGGKKAKEPEAIPAPIKEPMIVTYAPAVKRTIELDQRRRRNAIKAKLAAGEDAAGDPDSHLLLTRIKVATLLAAWLDSQLHVSDEMWELAGWVIWVSNDTRTRAHGRIRQKAQEKTHARAAAAVAQREAISDADERKRNAVYIRACDRILHLVTNAGDWISRSGTTGLNKKMSSKEKRDYREAGVDIEDVLGDLVLAGKLESREEVRSGNAVSEYRAKPTR